MRLFADEIYVGKNELGYSWKESSSSGVSRPKDRYRYWQNQIADFWILTIGIYRW
jgi:hypothetical protein